MGRSRSIAFKGLRSLFVFATQSLIFNFEAICSWGALADQRNMRVLTANGDDLTDTSNPSRVMLRRIAGSFAQFEKTRLVTKLRGARERIGVNYVLART